MKNDKKIKQNIFTNTFTAFCAILICFIAVEIILRFIKYDYKKYPGPCSTTIMRTSEYKIQFRTNSLNLRGSEIHPKSDDEFRVLCLGDSFTFGVGVDTEDTFVNIAEKILNQDKERYYIINAGGRKFIKEHY